MKNYIDYIERGDLMTSGHRPIKQNIDKKGYKLLTTSQTGELLGLAAGTIRNWCDQGRISFVRGEGGRRWISMAEVERLRSDNAYTTVSDAVDRMQAIIDDRDATIHDLISEKAGESKRNLEIVYIAVNKKLDTLLKRIDHSERAGAAKPPSIQLSENTVRRICRVVLEESARSGDAPPASPPTAPQTKPPDVTQVPAHSRNVSKAEHDSMMADINNR